MARLRVQEGPRRELFLSTIKRLSLFTKGLNISPVIVLEPALVVFADDCDANDADFVDVWEFR